MEGEGSGKFTRFVVGESISAPFTAPPEEICVTRHSIPLTWQKLNITSSKSLNKTQYDTGVQDVSISLTSHLHVGTDLYHKIVTNGGFSSFRLRIWEYAPHPDTDLSTTEPDWDFSAVKTFEGTMEGEVDGLVTYSFSILPIDDYTTPTAI